MNGKVHRDPEFPVREADRIALDAQDIASAEKIYLILNKPRGTVTTAADEKGREMIYACLPPGLPWLAPVGRLDKASEGLLLLTNDSEWAARVTDPASHLEKTYHVQVATRAVENLVPRLMKGISSQGELLCARRAALLRAGEKNCWFEIILDEGRNRHIRRMFDAIGIEVLRLVRVAIGPLSLRDLPKGESRSLRAEEKKMLDGALNAAR